MIYISTGGQRDQTAAQTAWSYYQQGIRGVELSGGAYSANCPEDLLSLPEDLQLVAHNYFPPPAEPFVLNLASVDSAIARRSIAHVRNAMQLNIRLGHPVYSFHAGFLIDPGVSELGRKLAPRKLLDRSQALEIFGERLASLAEEARREGVKLLIENNVVNKSNLATYGEDPLLLTNPDEIRSFMEKAPTNVGLLFDVAHFKVSSNTLGFDLTGGHETVRNWIRAYHLSDNNGSEDSNEALSPTSWFWELLRRDLDYYSIEVYRTSVPDLVRQYNLCAGRISESESNSHMSESIA